jgi:hypothetical protein
MVRCGSDLSCHARVEPAPAELREIPLPAHLLDVNSHFASEGNSNKRESAGMAEVEAQRVGRWDDRGLAGWAGAQLDLARIPIEVAGQHSPQPAVGLGAAGATVGRGEFERPYVHFAAIESHGLDADPPADHEELLS